MVDYTKSVQVGLNLAAIAERNRREIDEVFEELNRQLSIAVEGKVKVQREQFEEQPEDVLVVLLSRKKYWAISARHTTVPTARPWELARWTQAPAGYPCKISSAGTEVYCENREALESALAQLLASPTVGAALYSLIHMETPSANPVA